MFFSIGNIKFQSCCALLAGAFFFALAEAVLKLLTKAYSPYEIMLYRSLFLVLLIVSYTVAQGKLREFKANNIKMHILRSTFSAGSFLCATKALSGIQLYSYKSLYFLSPTITAVLGVLILGEKLSKWYVFSFLSCVIGVLIAFQPGNDIFSGYGLFALGAAACTSCAILVFKKMAQSESTYAIILYYSLCCIGLSAFLVYPNYFQVNIHDLYLFCGAAVLHIIASFLYTYGLRIQKLTTIALINYFSLPLSMALGWLFWRDLPSHLMLLSSLLILASNIFILLKELKSSSAT